MSGTGTPPQPPTQPRPAVPLTGGPTAPPPAPPVPPAPPIAAAPVPAATPPSEPPASAADVWWTKPGLAFSNKLLFLVMLVAAFVMKLDQVVLLMAGAVINMATNPDNFYFGSSEGSRGKDAKIAAGTPPQS